MQNKLARGLGLSIAATHGFQHNIVRDTIGRVFLLIIGVLPVALMEMILRPMRYVIILVFIIHSRQIAVLLMMLWRILQETIQTIFMGATQIKIAVRMTRVMIRCKII